MVQTTGRPRLRPPQSRWRTHAGWGGRATCTEKSPTPGEENQKLDIRCEPTVRVNTNDWFLFYTYTD